jgi:hypothetical protein
MPSLVQHTTGPCIGESSLSASRLGEMSPGPLTVCANPYDTRTQRPEGLVEPVSHAVSEQGFHRSRWLENLLWSEVRRPRHEEVGENEPKDSDLVPLAVKILPGAFFQRALVVIEGSCRSFVGLPLAEWPRRTR